MYNINETGITDNRSAPDGAALRLEHMANVSEFHTSDMQGFHQLPLGPYPEEVINAYRSAASGAGRSDP